MYPCMLVDSVETSVLFSCKLCNAVDSTLIFAVPSKESIIYPLSMLYKVVIFFQSADHSFLLPSHISIQQQVGISE